MTEEISANGALVHAFIKAQSEMTAVIKGAVNPAFRSRYADLASVIDAVLPALNKNGIGLVQSPRFDGEVVTVETVLVHAGGGTIKSELALRPSKQDPQGVGSAITYARRYALLAMCGVAPEDDDGNAASGPQHPTQRFTEAPKSVEGIKRLSSAQAKERGLHTIIEDAIAACSTTDELWAWNENFDKHTAQCPMSWLDAIHNKVLLRAEEIAAEQNHAEMDREFADIVS